jgi:probable rRNA maturation factor
MPSNINFFYEGTPFRFKAVRRTKAWIRQAVILEEHTLVALNFIFCSDGILHQINIDHLNHETLTDIITFDTGERAGSVEGDIYISIDRVKENAMKYGVSFNNELHRVIIHGVLHLLGYSDKTAQQKRMMRKKEAAYLSLGTF